MEYISRASVALVLQQARLAEPGGVGQKERTWLGHVLSGVNELASVDLKGDDPIATSVAHDGADRPQPLRAVHLENSLSAMRLPKRPRYSLPLCTYLRLHYIIYV